MGEIGTTGERAMAKENVYKKVPEFHDQKHILFHSPGKQSRIRSLTISCFKGTY